MSPILRYAYVNTAFLYEFTKNGQPVIHTTHAKSARQESALYRIINRLYALGMVFILIFIIIVITFVVTIVVTDDGGTAGGRGSCRWLCS